MEDQDSLLAFVPEWEADVVMTFPHDAKETTVLWFKEKIERIPGVMLQSISLSITGNPTKSMKLSSKSCHAFYIKATYECYLRGLEQMQIPKQLKDEYGGGNKEFSIKELNSFKDIESFETFFTSQERQSVLIFLINRIRAQEGDVVVLHDNKLYTFRHGEGIISRSLHKKIINQIFPVHDPNILGELKRGWIKNLKQLPPIDGLFNYFGSKIGLYFAWLQHYTCALGVHVLVGILFWIFQSRNQSSMKDVLVTSYDDINFVLFSFFNVIWATLYLKSWKRRSCELAYAWRTLNTQKELLSEPRPLFKGEEIINDITDKPDLYYAPWKRYVFRCLVSIPVIAICLLVCFIALILSLRLQDWWDEEMENFYFIPKVFLAATIPILNFLYEKIAVKLNYMENYRSEESHNNNLSLKLILFQFINSFLSLFYVAFYLQDMEKLRDLLTAILITRQVTGSIKETILPFATKYLQLFSIGLRDPLDPSSFDPTKIRADISQIKQIEREGASPVYKGTHEDYMEILIQFGYVTFFSSVYPLAGFLALLNNIFEIRGDALKLCIAYQRPFGERVPNIGVWQVAMECMGTIAIIVNCALIGQCGQIFKFLPSMSEISMILFIVGLEHVVLFLKMLITHLVPDIPSWVEKELTRIEHKRQELERKSETEKIDRSV